MTNLQLKVTLSAYTKGVIPDTSQFLTDAPDDGNIYGRQNNEWVEINQVAGDNLILSDNSGLILNREGNTVELSIDNQFLTEDEFKNLSQVDPNAIYYIKEDPIQLFINGDTAFTDGYFDQILQEQIPSAYNEIINGGSASTINFDLIMIPLNSLGE